MSSHFLETAATEAATTTTSNHSKEDATNDDDDDEDEATDNTDEENEDIMPPKTICGGTRPHSIHGEHNLQGEDGGTGPEGEEKGGRGHT